MPITKSDMNPILDLILIKYAIYFYRLKMKHRVVKAFLVRIGQINIFKY